MDPFGISAIADGATALSQTRLRSDMSVRVAKKAMEVQEQAALALIETISAGTYNSGGSLHSPATSGASIDVIA